ncbi:MAG: IS5 family transposase [Thermoplasmata archaeon]|nr:IS5 family transposase [Thermoplasmata archaeon]
MGCSMPWDGIKKYKDIRNWVEYNERLVKRGEFYITLDFIKHWDQELEKLNFKKNGRPYEYPNSFMQFSALVHEIFHLPYRQMEGFFRKLSEFISGLKAADYTTFFKRIAKLTLNIENENLPEEIILALDSSGIKVTNRGDWMRKKWRVQRGWIKVHIAVDALSKKLVALEITDESVGDNRKFKDLIKQAEKNLSSSKIIRVLADGAYDTKAAFNLLCKKQIEAGIKIRKNASTIARGSPNRAKYVRELMDIGYNTWKKKYQYGHRWASEGYLSGVKRIFGESVNATSQKGMIKEVKRKFILYNIFLNNL